MALTKKKKVSNFTAKKAPSSKFNSEQLDAMIRDRAYYIWEEKGRPQGCDMDIWLQAKKELTAKSK